jgi:hypothetical protein
MTLYTRALVFKENEDLKKGINPVTTIYDFHTFHIKEHLKVLPDCIHYNFLKHILTHIKLEYKRKKLNIPVIEPL